MKKELQKEKLEKITECFLELGTDIEKNINQFVGLCGTLLNATCALYNRLNHEALLCSLGRWNTPPDYKPVDRPDGHLCYDVIKHGRDEFFIVRDLPETNYAKTDPNVTPYGLKTYVGKAVKRHGAYIGSLCAVFQQDFVPNEEDKRVMSIIASAIGMEENRLKAETELRKINEELEGRIRERTAEIEKTNQELLREVEERKRAEDALRQILKGTSAVLGDQFFSSLVKHTAAAMHVRWAFLSELVDPKTKKARLIAFWNGNAAGETFEYDTKDTPCEQVVKGSVCFYPNDVQKQFPKDEWLRDQGVESYFAVPLIDSGGSIIGHLGIMGDKPMQGIMTTEPILKIFATRALAEIERKRSQDELQEIAVRDTLTGLYNRRVLNSKISETVALASRGNHYFAILLCDLDHFKTINDTQGHQAGDEILKAIAKSIQNTTRGTDLVFRWGGDEMVVILTKVTREGVLITADRIRKGITSLRDKFNLDLDISIGIALYPDHGQSTDELLRIADRALYIAKKGGDKIHIGEEEYVLHENMITPVFQPIFDVRLNQVFGYEALSRDATGKRSIMDLFMKFQAIGQLTDLKCFCFESQLKKAHELGLRKVFLNVDFNVLMKIEPAPAPPNMEVILEISEGEALHNIPTHLAVAKKWQVQGYFFAIDDFGAGFISLPFIAQLVPEHIKLDRSTIVQAVDSPKFRRALRDLLLALKNVSTNGIIAEGIETAKELQVAKDLGLSLIQGFLLGKPQELSSKDPK